MEEDSPLEILPEVPTVPDGRSSVLTLEIPILPALKKGLVNLEGVRQELLQYIHQADASLAVLQVAVNLLTQSRALACVRSEALNDYTSAVFPEDGEGEPIPF